MALIVYVNTPNSNGMEVLRALQQINNAFATLNKLDGLRAESVGAGVQVFSQNFGVTDLEQAQAFSDRLAAITAWFNDEETWIETAAQARQALEDLTNAVTTAP